MKAQFQLPPDDPVDPMEIRWSQTQYERSEAALYHCFIQQHVRRLNARDKAQEDAQDAAEGYRLGIRMEGGQ